MMAALKAEHLSIKRSGRDVLTDISFSVLPGELYALLGGNGAGKTTTLLSFLGFLRPSSGQVYVAAQPVSKHPERARRRISYLPEAFSLYPQLNAYENLDYFLGLAGIFPKRNAINAALDRVALSQSDRQKRLKDYSKGMRQKTALALALLRDSRFLLLDEPTSGLDPRAIEEFNSLLKELAKDGKTILMVTHDLHGAFEVADRVGLMLEGCLVEELKTHSSKPADLNFVRQGFKQGRLS